MPIELGRIEALFRYPVKSMRGERLEAAALGWHGLAGDRRLALRRREERGGFPWLSASLLPQLVLFTPLRRDAADGAGVVEGAEIAHPAAGASGEAPPTHVRTPDGAELPAFGEALATEIGRRLGQPVEMMRLRSGTFDEASISVITSDTVGEICRLAGVEAEVRRFRPNIVLRSARAIPFEEDVWPGGVLVFGEGDDAPAVTVTQRDVRCAIVNIDPDAGSTQPAVLRAVVRVKDNRAGVYGAVTRTGRLAVGQAVFLHR